MNLVRAVFEPLPAPVVVEAPPRVVEKTVIVETAPPPAAAAPKTVIVTGAEEFTVPEYSYVLYEDEYIPYYKGWLYLGHDWHWAGAGLRPPEPPGWTPPPRPRHVAPPPHKVIARVEHRPGHGPGHAPAPVIVRRGERRPEPPPRTTGARPERKEVVVRTEPPRTTGARPERKETGARTEPPKKEKVTVTPDKRKEPPQKKGR